MRSATEVERIYTAIPQLTRVHEAVLLKDVWEQPELSMRDRSLVTCAVLATLGREDVLKGHLRRAIQRGFAPTPDEMRGLIVQVALYAGWPAALAVARDALDMLGHG